MKKVIIKQQTDTIDIEEVKDETPVFVKKDGKFVGMVVYVGRWHISFGTDLFGGISSLSKQAMLRTCIASGYELYIED